MTRRPWVGSLAATSDMLRRSESSSPAEGASNASTLMKIMPLPRGVMENLVFKTETVAFQW